MPNREDPSLYRGILVRFAEALLTSKLTALEAAVRSDEPQLMKQSARDYAHFARLYAILFIPSQPEPNTKRHHCRYLFDYLHTHNIAIQRVRRAPQVIGDERVQLARFVSFIRQISDTPDTATFRQRGDRFVMTLIWRNTIPKRIASLVLSQLPERNLINHLSEDWLETYILLLALQQSGVQVHCQGATTKRLSFSWRRARQLQIKL